MSTWTIADLAAIDAAIKNGVSEVATADGKKVKFHNPDALLRLRQRIVEAAGLGRRPRAVLLGGSVRGE